MFASRFLAARPAIRALHQATSRRVGLNSTGLLRNSAVPSLKRAPVRRNASTAATASSAGYRIRNFFYGSALVLGFGFFYIYITDTRASIHRWLVIPLFRIIYRDPEEAHEAGNRALKQLWTFGLYPRERGDPDGKGDLAVDVFGQLLKNPIGTSAGIDKHAEIPDPLLAIGPAVIELGGTTPLPQKGNDKPRVFRLTSQNAMINRYGLNSEGADHVASQLRLRVRHFADACGFGHNVDGETRVLDGEAGVPPGSLTEGKLLAVNIAKNKATPENDIAAVTKDYLYCAERLAPYADIIVVNVSSPNTPGLRSLQSQESLTKILTAVVRAARSVQRVTKPAVMVKVSPDEDSDEQVAGICQAVWEADVDGIIVGNTTNQRPEALKHMDQYSSAEQQHLLEMGGFSGPHLYEKTLSMVKKYKKLLGERPPSDNPSPSGPPARSSGSVSKVVEQTKVDLAGSPSGDAVTDSIQTESIPLKNMAEKKDSEKQPLLKLPEIRFYDQSREEQDMIRESPGGAESKRTEQGQKEERQAEQQKTESKKPQPKKTASKEPETNDKESGKTERPGLKDSKDKALSRRDEPKVIFATGGITNGKQALEILNAGASVAMVYTALVYGGVGTISRIKDEMRQEIETKKKERRKGNKRAVKKDVLPVQ